MRFGVREICNVTLRAKAKQTLGSRTFYKDEPILYFETLKTSSLEGASTTVYATGGRGNARLIAWEGERTLTFNMEDALISPESFSILSGAGLVSATDAEPIYVHTTSRVEVKKANTIELPETPCWNQKGKIDLDHYKAGADIFVMTLTNGQIDSEPCVPVAVDGKVLTCYSHAGTIDEGDIVLVDYYVKRTGGAQTIEITADKFGGNYYLEAQTLFRDESTGVDMPAEFIIPNCKVQSNFTFTMAASGDPSTFTFTMDAFPDYTKFNQTEKVLAAIQVITEDVDDAEETRQACEEFVATAPHAGVDSEGNPRVTLTYDNTGTEKFVKLTASGGDVPGGSYDDELFGNVTGDAVEIDLVFRVSDDATYTVRQNNPSLSKLYPEEAEFVNNVKEKSGYTAEQLAGGYGLLLGDYSKGNVTVEVINDDTDEIIKTVRITNKVNFKKTKNDVSSTSLDI